MASPESVDLLRKSFAELSRKPTYDGRIEFIKGPMFSGKSTELLRRIRRFMIAKLNCLIVKYKADTRYSEHFATHDMQTHKAVACNNDLDNVYDVCMEADVIGIDEGQFFHNLADFCETMANYGKIVIVAGLDGKFTREPFESIVELESKCEFVTKLRAMCECGNEASFTYKYKDKEPAQQENFAEAPICDEEECSFTPRVEHDGKNESIITDGDDNDVNIGGAEMYVSLCRQCYFTRKNEDEKMVEFSADEQEIEVPSVGFSSLQLVYDPSKIDAYRVVVRD